MTNQEAIKELKGLINSIVGREEIDRVCREVIEYLQKQEPRVMTFEEIKDNMGVPVWVEYADDENWNGYGVPTSDFETYIMIFGANDFCSHNARTYNVKWRCWSARPSQDQMLETKWEEHNG